MRDTLGRQGTAINHSKALELIAAQYGFRDWNTLMGVIPSRGVLQFVQSRARQGRRVPHDEG